MSPTSDLTVVVCHGCYHSPAPYMPMVDTLKSADIDTYCPQLPTSDLAKLKVDDVVEPNFDLGPPAGGYFQGEQDTQVILDIAKLLVEEQGKSVKLHGHSAGGRVASQAATRDQQVKNRVKRNRSVGIIGVLYVGAFIVPVGKSNQSFFQPNDGTAILPPSMTFHRHGAEGLDTMVKPQTFLFNDVESGAAQKWLAYEHECIFKLALGLSRVGWRFDSS